MENEANERGLQTAPLIHNKKKDENREYEQDGQRERKTDRVTVKKNTQMRRKRARQKQQQYEHCTI